MITSVFEGRESVKQTYDNILIYLNGILRKDLMDELQVDLSILEDKLMVNEDNEEYSIFKYDFFKILDKYLLYFGVLLRHEKSFDVYFKILYVLYNIKQLDYYKEEIEIIIYGDYNDEDKLLLLFSIYFEEVSEVMDTIDTSSLFFDFIKDNIKEEKIYNLDLITRAVSLSKYDDSFKTTELFSQVMKGEIIYKLTLMYDLEIVKNELIERVYKNIIDKYDYKEEILKVTNEIIFTLVFYHYDIVVDLTKLLDRDFVLKLFNKPILEIDKIMENINTRLINLLKDSNE